MRQKFKPGFTNSQLVGLVPDSEYRKRWKKAKPGYFEEARRLSREKRADYKFTVLAMYSEGQPICSCCNENRIEFLTINHLIGKGHRRDHLPSTALYRFLIVHDFPSGFNVLCFNCNCALGHFGFCPHTLERDLIDQETQHAREEMVKE